MAAVMTGIFLEWNPGIAIFGFGVPETAARFTFVVVGLFLMYWALRMFD
ncbi:MAG: hypothetical protein NXI18_21875 [Alphaproteobacteria bacterium]|nr:hypothetical protein [Alphaproteobacteria bacterium]